MMEIQVPMELRSVRPLSPGMVEVWGWVGDYEVMVCLPLRSAAGQAALLWAQGNAVVTSVEE